MSIFPFTLGVFALIAGILIFCYFSIKKALHKKGMNPERSNRIVNSFVLALVLWIGFISLIAFKGFFADFSTFPPKIVLSIIPPIIFVFYCATSSSIRKLIKTIPPFDLIFVQAFRIIVELFLWFSFIKLVIPVQMTFEGYNYEIVFAITAPIIAFLFFRKNAKLTAQKLNMTIVWNIIGIIMLVIIVTISFLSTDSPIRKFFTEPSADIIGTFPFILIPAFIVPFALAIHVVSIVQLKDLRKTISN